jgi:hypothetical protein
MLIKTTLFACGSCGLHVRRTELRCPHCDAPMRTAQGAIPQTRTAMAMGLSFLAMASVASGCLRMDDQSGVGGEGGEGGEGAANSTGKTKATTPSATTPTTAVSSVSSYGTGVSQTQYCNDLGQCHGDSPYLGCFECAVFGGTTYLNSGACADNYLECKGASGDCFDGEPQCCQLETCLETCSADPSGYWDCACGSQDEAGCTTALAPAGSCFGDYPIGAELMYGPLGWVACVADVCVSSCP